MRMLAMWLAVVGVILAFGGGLVALVPLLAQGSAWAGVALLVYMVGGTVAAWWVLCWAGFRLGIR